MDFQTKDGKSQRYAINEMSDEYKNILCIFSDIAYRMAILNPMLGDQVLKKTPGIVLIDEVDLYLHSQWLQTILDDFRAIFPSIQFIVSSRESAVVNSVTREQIRILDNGKIYSPVVQICGKDALSLDSIEHCIPRTLRKQNQEKLYVELYRSGNKDSKEKAICYFIDNYENFIKQEMKEFCPTYISKYFDDLLFSGKVGILEALQKYDADKESFTTCSKLYIKHELTRFLCEIIFQSSEYYARLQNKLKDLY